MITISSADKMLKTYYLDAIADSLNTQVNPLMAKFEKTTDFVLGKEIRKVVSNGLNGGFGAGTEDGELPTSSQNEYVELSMQLKNLYGQLEISDKALRAGNSNDGAVLNVLETEMNSLLNSAKFNFGRMLYGDGRGILGTVKAVSGSTLTLDTVKYITEGMIIDVIGSESEETTVSARRVSGVDRTNKKITLSGASLSGAVAVGDFITIQGSYYQEITGLGALFNDDTYLYNLNRDTYKWLKPYKATSTTIDNVTIAKAIDQIEENSGCTTDFIVCSAGVKRAYIDYLTQNNLDIVTTQVDGGYKAIMFNGIPIVSDRFCPEGTMYLLHTPSFKIYQLCDWKWLEDDDGKVLKQMSNRPTYKATLVKYAELLCERPIAQGVITGITEK